MKAHVEVLAKQGSYGWSVFVVRDVVDNGTGQYAWHCDARTRTALRLCLRTAAQLVKRIQTRRA